VFCDGFIASYEWRGSCLVRLEEQYRKCVVLIGTAAPGVEDEIGERDSLSPATLGIGLFIL
jgi:hypothetical protein